MLCRKPYMVGSMPVGCGQCLCCRINRRRLWTTRIVLESYCHDASCFATLTYSDDDLPSGGNLDPRHVQLFLKSVRKRVAPRKLRFFAVGEYGDKSWRPHYHLALFGLSLLETHHVEAVWRRGFSRLDELNHDTAQYIAGYTVKKLTQSGASALGGRSPEFARMSLRPGIGGAAAAIIADGLPPLVGGADVPSSVRYQGKKHPVGRYLTKIIRESLLTEEEIAKVKQRYAMEKSAELQALLREEIQAGGLGSPSRFVAAQSEGRAASVEARQKILNSKRTL